MKLFIVLVAACSCFPYILTDDNAAAAAAAAAAPTAAAAAAAADGDDVASAAAAAAAASGGGDSSAAAAAAAASGSGGSSPLPICKCQDYVRTVCGSNNVSYRNICFLNCQSVIDQSKDLPPIHRQYYGACHREACRCHSVWDPLCGSDGKTYRNPCLLRCENRRRYALGLPPIKVDYKGECIDCKSKCSKVYDPVCASDGKTYGNICLLRCENSIRYLKGLPALYVSHTGECVCNCNYCPRFFQPVCGSDKRTYWNICWLVCRSRCNVANGRPPIHLVKNGYC